MSMTKLATDRPALTEAEIEESVSTAVAGSAVAGHFIDEVDRELTREVLRGELTVEDAIGSIRKSVHDSK
jgi:hypothetical protein